MNPMRYISVSLWTINEDDINGGTMIDGEFIVGTKGLDLTGYIRTSVFTGEQGVDPAIEQDAYDHFAHHLIVKDGGEKVGVGRLIYKDGQYLIGRIAVIKEARGKHYGDLIVRMLCTRAFSIGAKVVTVHAQTQVEDFYKKIGFIRVSEVYQEASIDHVTMEITEKTFTHPCSCGDGCSC